MDHDPHFYANQALEFLGDAVTYATDEEGKLLLQAAEVVLRKALEGDL